MKDPKRAWEMRLEFAIMYMLVGPGFGTQDIQHRLTKQAALNHTEVPSLVYFKAYLFGPTAF